MEQLSEEMSIRFEQVTVLPPNSQSWPECKKPMWSRRERTVMATVPAHNEHWWLLVSSLVDVCWPALSSQLEWWQGFGGTGWMPEQLSWPRGCDSFLVFSFLSFSTGCKGRRVSDCLTSLEQVSLLHVETGTVKNTLIGRETNAEWRWREQRCSPVFPQGAFRGKTTESQVSCELWSHFGFNFAKKKKRNWSCATCRTPGRTAGEALSHLTGAEICRLSLCFCFAEVLMKQVSRSRWLSF